MSAGERGEMFGDEFLHLRGLLATDSFDQVVVAREDSVLVVDGDVAQVLRQELGKPWVLMPSIHVGMSAGS